MDGWLDFLQATLALSVGWLAWVLYRATPRSDHHYENDYGA